MTNPIDDPFLTGGNERIDPDDLDGRLLLIFPIESKQMTSRTDGGKYTAVFGDVVVLTGEPTDQIQLGVKHMLHRIMFTGSRADRLQASLSAKRPLLARHGSAPSSYNKKVLAYFFEDVSDEDKALGRAAYAEYQEANDPFAE